MYKCSKLSRFFQTLWECICILKEPCLTEEGKHTKWSLFSWFSSGLVNPLNLTSISHLAAENSMLHPCLQTSPFTSHLLPSQQCWSIFENHGRNHNDLCNKVQLDHGMEPAGKLGLLMSFANHSWPEASPSVQLPWKASNTVHREAVRALGTEKLFHLCKLLADILWFMIRAQ